MSANLGINIVEVDGTASPSIQGASTSVAGFLVRSRRGLPGIVRLVTSYRQFVEYFGDVWGAAVGAYAVRGFFDNGGAVAYVARIVDATTPNTGATAAWHDFTAFTVKAGYLGHPDPGSWGKDLSISIEVAGGSTGTFNLVVWYKNPVTGQTTQVERWNGLAIGQTGAADPQQVNDPLVGSRYIFLSTVGTTAPGATTQPVPLDHDGTDDSPDTINALVAQLLGTGAGTPPPPPIFDAYQIQLLCIPDTNDHSQSTPTSTIFSQAIQYCAARGDCMFVGHVPDNTDLAGALSWNILRTADRSASYGALYYPFIKVADPLGTTRWIPPTGHVLGIYARTERERGIWKAPAGSAAQVGGALDVKTPLTDTQLTLLVQNGGINGIRAIPGEGIVVDSSRTLSSSTLWLFVNVRLLFNYVKTSLKYGLRWTIQEPNDPTLQNKVKYNSVIPFLMGLWRRGAFGAGAPDKLFTVKCDAENNPPASVTQGIFNVEVYFYPSRPAETVIITVGQQDSGSTVTELSR